MVTLAVGAVSLVALLHLYFLVLEMFLWQTPRIFFVQAVPAMVALALVWGAGQAPRS